MIELIAADLDGTLLDSKKQLSPDLFPLIRQLRQHKIHFAAASGRQYENLRMLFSEVCDEISFICENGAAVYHRSNCLFADQMPAPYFIPPIHSIRTLSGVNAVLCTHAGAFIECSTDTVFVKNAQMYYEKLTIVPDLIAVLAREPAFKLAVFEKSHAETGCFPMLRAYEEHFAVVLSGADWVDLMNPKTNKGIGLHQLAAHLHIPLGHTMAFGDYLNDTELLQTAGHAFVMENGHPTLKQIANHIAPSNDDNGVVRAIQSYFSFTNS